MTGTVVYVPVRPVPPYSHPCSLPNASSFTTGAIIRCDDCGAYSKAVYRLDEEYYMDYHTWEFMTRVGLWWARRRGRIPAKPKRDSPKTSRLAQLLVRREDVIARALADPIHEEDECR